MPSSFEYYTTSLMPSGSRLVTNAFCPPPSLFASQQQSSQQSIIPQVYMESLADAAGSGNALRWVVGTPASNDPDDNELYPNFNLDPNLRQFWFRMDYGHQFALSFTDGNDGDYDYDEDEDDMTDEGTIVPTPPYIPGLATDHGDRPLIITNQAAASSSIANNNNNNSTSATASLLSSSSSSLSSLFAPLAEPSMTAPLSEPVPTPNGGWLLVEQRSSDGSYQITQLSPTPETPASTYELEQLGEIDVTHESLRNDSVLQNPLPDTKWAYSTTRQMWALYSQATNRYNHAVIGDDLEANALTILKWNPATEQVEFHAQTTLLLESTDTTPGTAEDSVFEGLGPMWGKVSGDFNSGSGSDDLITTVSNSQVGARLRVYSLLEAVPSTSPQELELDDTTTTTPTSPPQPPMLIVLAQAPAIGRGGRWLHQLAVGPLGPNGETEIVEIRTPHIGGIVRYYQYQTGNTELQLVASKAPYTSHDIGSRNLDRVVVGDFNGDGIPELVVQNQDKDVLVGLQRTDDDDGVKIVWSVPLDSPLESNIGVSCSRSGIREIMFATRNQELMRLKFVPTDNTDTNTMIPPMEDIEEVSSPTATSAAAMGPVQWGRPHNPRDHLHVILCFCVTAFLWRRMCVPF